MIDHADHDHPATRAGRAACRAGLADLADRFARHTPAERNLLRTVLLMAEHDLDPDEYRDLLDGAETRAAHDEPTERPMTDEDRGRAYAAATGTGIDHMWTDEHGDLRMRSVDGAEFVLDTGRTTP